MADQDATLVEGPCRRGWSSMSQSSNDHVGGEPQIADEIELGGCAGRGRGIEPLYVFGVQGDGSAILPGAMR